MAKELVLCTNVLFQMPPSCGLVLCPRSYAFRLPSRCVRRRRRHLRQSPAVARRRLRVQATLSGVDECQRLPRPFPFIETFHPYLTTLPRPPRVAVDVDEVLGQFLVALNGFCAEEYGMTHDVKDYHVYHFATVWGCSQGESVDIVHAFFESSHFRELPLVPGAFEALCKLQKWCDLHVVTSRQHVIRDITIDWLKEHYPGIFTSIHFGNHYAREGVTKKKSELCKEIDACVLIDDNPAYAMDCASSGIDVILYNDQNRYPWSRLSKEDGHERIREVTSWSDIPEILRMIFEEQKTDQAVYGQ